jgi:hypothetical protein
MRAALYTNLRYHAIPLVLLAAWLGHAIGW